MHFLNLKGKILQNDYATVWVKLQFEWVTRTRSQIDILQLANSADTPVCLESLKMNDHGEYFMKMQS